MDEFETESKNQKKLNLQYCVDYGGRDEIARAYNKMFEAGIKETDENTIAKHLDSKDIPDPDLIIRTSGEKRLSGIMPFQSDYAEIYFSETPFPEFGADEFRLAILDYSRRDRRFGGSSPSVSLQTETV
jgi:undecaprenyl diphosphate synthase